MLAHRGNDTGVAAGTSWLRGSPATDAVAAWASTNRATGGLTGASRGDERATSPIETAEAGVIKVNSTVKRANGRTGSKSQEVQLPERRPRSSDDATTRSPVIELVGVFEGRIVDVGHDQVTVMLAGSPAKIDDFEDLMRAYGIVELQRTGRVALPKLERQAPRLRSVKGKAG